MQTQEERIKAIYDKLMVELQGTLIPKFEKTRKSVLEIVAFTVRACDQHYLDVEGINERSVTVDEPDLNRPE